MLVHLLAFLSEFSAGCLTVRGKTSTCFGMQPAAGARAALTAARQTKGVSIVTSPVPNAPHVNV